ncbi:MAG: hypothetical protein ACT4P8_16805 [Betaproteobacteria bacterium]
MNHRLRTRLARTALTGALLITAACSERPQTAPGAVDRLVDENHKAAAALVEVARDAAAMAGEQAQNTAHAARGAYDAAVGPEGERK